MTKVLQAFQDKETDIIYYIGDDYEGDRIEELAEAGFVAKDEPKKGGRKKATDK